MMPTSFEDLRVLQAAQENADKIWKQVVRWDDFAKDVVGKQMARASDSIGANIAESYGRFNYGEKLQFLYYARGSLFETKFWLNRAKTRELLSSSDVQTYTSRLTDIAKQLNAFADSLKTQRSSPKTVREEAAEYHAEPANQFNEPLFDEQDLAWLQS